MDTTTIWHDVFADSLTSLWTGVAEVVPNIILAVLIFIIGWLIATLLEHAVERLISAFKVDDLLAHTGLDELTRKAGYKLDTGRFVGTLVRWFFIILFLQVSLNIVNLVQVTEFLNEVLLYLPRVVVALIVLFAGSLLADAMSKIVIASSKAADLNETDILGRVTRWIIWVFAIFVAMSELNIGQEVIVPLIYGIVAMLAIAGGLSFGLGGRNMVQDWLESIHSSKKKKSKK